MNYLITEMEKITGAFWKPVADTKIYRTPVDRITTCYPCRKHMFSASTCIVKQPTAQPFHRRGPDDYEPVNLNHAWKELECEACYWDVHLTGIMECRLCNRSKVCNYSNVVCIECNKKHC